MLRAVAPETTARMKRVRRSGTAPEVAVRRVLTDMGVSFRTCAHDLPGTPDIVNRRAAWAVFVHGCFWHGHEGCRLARVPKTNERFWLEKLAANRERDARKERALRARGFRVATVWQCETQEPERLARRLRRLVACERAEMGGDDALFLRLARPLATRPKSEVRIVDLFSGCGGLTLGVEEAARTIGKAATIRLAVERDPPTAATYRANFAPAYGAEASEITDWFDGGYGAPLTLLERRTRRSIGSVDVLVGGPPCQGHSTLNNHTRGNDPKNALYLTMVRAAEVLRPRSLLIENVPALERDSGRTLDVAVEQLSALGYKLDHRVVSVADLGVPQLRRRHVLLAHKDVQPDVRVAVEQGRAPHRSLRWAIGDLASRYGSTPFDTAGVLSSENRERATYLLTTDQFDLPNAMRPPCQRDDHKYKSMYGRLSWDLPAQTMTTGFGSPGQGRYLHPAKPRTLTPHEAARLQFFPDWYDFSALRHRAHLARAIGNAVPPKLGFVLARYLLTLGAQSNTTAVRESRVRRAPPLVLAGV